MEFWAKLDLLITVCAWKKVKTTFELQSQVLLGYKQNQKWQINVLEQRKHKITRNKVGLQTSPPWAKISFLSSQLSVELGSCQDFCRELPGASRKDFLPPLSSLATCQACLLPPHMHQVPGRSDTSSREGCLWRRDTEREKQGRRICSNSVTGNMSRKKKRHGLLADIGKYYWQNSEILYQ